MKKVIKVRKSDGLVGLFGKQVMLFCLNYIYTGKLSGANGTCVLLENPSIVYETGAFNEAKFKDAQAIPNSIYVQVSAIESFGETNKK